MDAAVKRLEAYLKGRLEAADFTVQRLFQDVREQGYAGSYNLAKRFLAPLREAQRRRAVIRFETVPGEQAQVDWAGGFGFLPAEGIPWRLSCFSMILGYSRRQYIEFTLSHKLTEFLGCHVRAFESFAGVPAEVPYDNLPAAVLAHVGAWWSIYRPFSI
jgi:transposase